MSAEHDRDQAVDKMLRRTLADDPGQASASCLDAETIAAWVDDGLDAHAMAVAEAHVAQCARCQATVGVTVRTAAAPPRRARWWQRAWGAGWLIPVGAAVTAVALFMVVPRQQPRKGSGPEAPVRARADALKATGVEATAPTAEQPARPSEARQSPAAQAPVEPGLTARAPSAVRDSTLDKAIPAAPAAPAEAKTAQSAGAPAAIESLARRSAERAPAVALDLASQSTAGREIVSPDPAVRWRLGAPGALEHTTNGGTSWEPLSTGILVDLTAGSAPTPTVCWLVGRSGAVLVTTDGRRWLRVPFPEAADLSSVEAADARTAVVTTVDGRSFRTSDAGRTWRP